jgi:hypothetical protein
MRMVGGGGSPGRGFSGGESNAGSGAPTGGVEQMVIGVVLAAFGRTRVEEKEGVELSRAERKSWR